MNAPASSIQLIVNTATAEELKQKVTSLAAQFGVSLPDLEPNSEPKAETPKEVAKETVKEEKKTTKKVKEEKTETVKEETKTETPKSETSSPAHTVDDVKAALQKLSSSKGIGALKEFLGTFKTKDGAACVKVSDVQASNYAELIAQAEEKSK